MLSSISKCYSIPLHVWVKGQVWDSRVKLLSKEVLEQLSERGIRERLQSKRGRRRGSRDLQLLFKQTQECETKQIHSKDEARDTKKQQHLSFFPWISLFSRLVLLEQLMLLMQEYQKRCSAASSHSFFLLRCQSFFGDLSLSSSLSVFLTLKSKKTGAPAPLRELVLNNLYNQNLTDLFIWFHMKSVWLVFSLFSND